MARCDFIRIGLCELRGKRSKKKNKIHARCFIISLLALACFWHFLGITFQLLNYMYFFGLGSLTRGSVPEMRIWYILLIKSDWKWCIHLSRSLFLYSCKRGVSSDFVFLWIRHLTWAIVDRKQKWKFAITYKS